jgi:hypothetical protein
MVAHKVKTHSVQVFSWTFKLLEGVVLYAGAYLGK